MEPIAPAPRIANSVREVMGAPTIAPFARCMAGDAEIALVPTEAEQYVVVGLKPDLQRSIHDSTGNSARVCADLPHQSVSRNDRTVVQRRLGRRAGDWHA